MLIFHFLDVHDGFSQLLEIGDHRGHHPQLTVNGGLGALDDHLYLVLLRGPCLYSQKLASPAVYILFEAFTLPLFGIFQVTK